VQHLDRDAPADVDVVRFVDAPHRALAAQPAHVVAAADGGADARVFSQPPAERPTAERAAGAVAALAAVRPAGGGRPRRGVGQLDLRDHTRQQRLGAGDQGVALLPVARGVLGEHRTQELGDASRVGLGRGRRQETGQVGAHRLAVW
jgi:hypothetical protein